jgi:hypothetical protein
MKPAKTYENVIKRFYRCQKSLHRARTISERIVVTLNGVIKMTHGGYRCSNPECEARERTYRSAAADALVLPRLTFGLDVVILIGQLRLGKHQTLDETHEQVCERLAPLGARMSRREVLYLFDVFCNVLRVASDVKQDKEWMSKVEKNKGLLLSMDGIQPDKGNETVYLVRDALTGRLLAAENVTESSVERLKQVLSPVVELSVPVLGTISDAQESEVMALSQLWPDVPHQTCQFHALREASRPGFEEDRTIKTQMRKGLQPKVKSLRKQIKSHSKQLSEEQAKQLEVLDDYALGVQAALNLDGKLPFEYAGVQAVEALDEGAASLDELEKRDSSSQGIEEEIETSQANSSRTGTLARASRAMQTNTTMGARCRIHS